MRGPLMAAGLVLSLLWPAGAVALQKPSSRSRVLPDFDSRVGVEPVGALTAQTRDESLQRLRARLAGPLRMRFHAGTGAMRVLWAEGEPLSPAGGGAPAAAAEHFIDENAALLGLPPRGASTLMRTREEALVGGALTRVVFEQVVDGIPVFEGVVWAHVDRLGRVVKLASGALHRTRESEEPNATASLAAEDALLAAIANVRPDVSLGARRRSSGDGPDRRTVFEHGPLRSDVPVSLVWFPTPAGDRLAWRVRVEPDGFPQVYDVVIDAQDGTVLYRRNLVRYAEGAGRVPQSDETQQQEARRPDENPAGSNPAGPADPPNGCPPVNGYVSRDLVAPFRDAPTVLSDGGRLRGNNVSVYRGTTGTLGALGTLANGIWQFDYPFGSASSVETALFFASNFAHDFYYDLGFDEASGNFQVDNLGRGGLGADPVQTLARADGRNNATFEPTPEGQRPTMSLFLFDGAGCWSTDLDGDGAPDLEGGYDRDIVLHEYHHGVSFRLNPSFTGVEADAMGEGGGDFFAYSVSGNTQLAEYSVPPSGIREVNAKTYADFSCLFLFLCEPHDNGEIWANVLWDLRERFRTDLVLGSEALATAELHRLYLDGLRLSPPSPTMPDLRDAMLQADLLRNPGAGPGGSENYCRIWTVFAGRGLGTGALDTQDTGDNTVVADEQIPLECPQPIRVTLAVTDAQAKEAGLDPGLFTVTRTGDTSQDLTVHYTVSGTALPDVDYTALTGAVTIPAGSTTATIVVTPIDDTVYEPTKTVKVTLAADPAYELGSVVAGTVNLASDDLGADLVLLSLTVPATAAPGTSISVSDTAKNQGAGAAAPSLTRFYLSKNAALDDADVLLGSQPVPGLAPGSTLTATLSLTLPADTVAGRYYVLARADSDAVVPETNEGNNTRSAVVAVGADLVVSALSGPALGGAGGSILVSDTTKNQGAGVAAASLTQFFLSKNAALDATDVLLGSRVAPALGAASVSTTATALSIPAGTAAGTYYVVARADGESVVPETNEANNTRSVVVAVGPDLVVTALTAPAETGAGATIQVSDSTTNQGGGAVGPTATQFFLSANANLDAADVFLGARPVPALAPGATSSAPFLLTLPLDTAAGSYYILARADGDAVVPETNEANNTTRRALVAVGPDLVVTALAVPATAGTGATIAVSDTTTNQGGGSVAASVTRFFLSKNALFDAADVPLGSRAVPPLAAGAASTGPTSLLIPADTVAGSYSILARADDAGAVAETSEINNMRTASVLIGPDLVVSALTVPASAAAGGTISVNETTRNQGTGGVPASRTRFYLSANASLDATDLLLGSRDVPGLGAGVASAGSTVLTLPADTPSDAFYIVARADDEGEVAETNETNNTRVAAIAVGPDLVVALLTVPATAKAGSVISVSDTTKNTGGGGAGASQTRYYLSTNGVLDDADILLGSRAVPSLAPGATNVAATSLTLPAGTAPRLYYILAKADGDEGIGEVNEANNLRVAALTVTSP